MTNRAGIAAAFVFYGPPPMKEAIVTDPDALKRIEATVYGFYAGNDARIDATIQATREAMAEAATRYKPLIYDEAGHGYMRAGEAPDASEANPKARTEVWERWKQLMRLGSPGCAGK